MVDDLQTKNYPLQAFSFWSAGITQIGSTGYIIGGLIYITKVGLGMTALNSFLATLGVLLILFVGDNFAQQIDNWLKRRKMKQENEE